jgi:hypothetical protein
MSDIACVCGVTSEPAAQVGKIAICSACGATLVAHSEGQYSRAMLKDIEDLSPFERAQLIRARAAIVRPRGLKHGT